MQAIVRHRYGSPDALVQEERPTPALADDAVLVRVRASSVNAFDWHVLRGKPYLTHVEEGLRRPNDPTMGLDVAGDVEAVGSAVADLRPGDAVFGSRRGAFAELVSGRTFVTKPANFSYSEAAALPVAGCTALQALRDKAAVHAGERVAVIGAGGGVGTFAVQIARAFGAHVTAVTGPSHVELLRSLGSDAVLDHGADLRAAGPFDVVIDIGGTRSFRVLAGAMRPTGRLVMVGPGHGEWIGPLTRIAAGVIRSRIGSRRFLPFLAKVTKDDLLVLKQLVEAGHVRPVIDRAYPLSGTADAIRYVEDGNAHGKVAITI